MQFSKSTDYALHALIHLTLSEKDGHIGIKELAHTLGVSVSYLSKIMSKLRQDGIVRAVPGVNGGYELARPADEITFLEVIQVIEGREQLFECSNLHSQQHQLLSEEMAEVHLPKHRGSECLVKKVMDGAEEQLHQYLRQHTIQAVVDQALNRQHGFTSKK
ncbi:RrF2 family transcriptional regulator [Paenibacillus campinasensis]|uniref:Transcriptional regulator n=1 Tax=Paenibacillus campinasensis TaxID=66347 RepID=A0A268F1M1_9BACL|nr:Rrf2 family transcriptional regulator [Paenibacillus campinasensis]PAD79272.1 transcriptional regulator [Paenibacillus campinasensis]